MLSLAEKRALFSDLAARVKHEFHTLRSAHRATQEGATHEEAKPENDKDTRALEQTYLARGQAERVAALERESSQIETFSPRAFSADEPLALGALLATEDEAGREQLYLLSPVGAGEVLTCKLGPVKVVTPRSPLGRALAGSRQEDDVDIRTPTGKRTLSIIWIC